MINVDAANYYAMRHLVQPLIIIELPSGAIAIGSARGGQHLLHTLPPEEGHANYALLGTFLRPFALERIVPEPPEPPRPPLPDLGDFDLGDL